MATKIHAAGTPFDVQRQTLPGRPAKIC